MRRQGGSIVQRNPLAIIAGAVALGICVAQLARGAPWAWWTASVIAWGGWLVAFVCRRGFWSAMLLLSAAATVGGTWYRAYRQLYAVTEVGRYAHGFAAPVCLRAVVVRSPRIVPAGPTNPLRIIPELDQSRLEAGAVAIRDNRQWRAVSGRVTILVEGHLLGLKGGDQIEIVGQIARAREPRNPGEFDFSEFARGRRQLAVVRCEHPAGVHRVSERRWYDVRQWIDDCQRLAGASLGKFVDPAHRGLAQAIVLGIREGITDEQRRDFLTTGVAHIVAISGLNIGILVAGLWPLLGMGWPGHGAVLLLICGVTAAYAVVAGADPPVVRATAMVWILCGARHLGRPTWTYNMLGAAALVVMAANPMALFQAGAQLSFLAIVALVAYCRWQLERANQDDPLAKLLQTSRPWYVKLSRGIGCWARELTLSGIAVWIVTLPLVMQQFHVVSTVALLLNPLVWGPVTLAMWSAMLTIVCDAICPPLAVIPGAICNRSFGLLNLCVATAGDVPLSHFWVPGPPGWWVLGFYFLLALALVLNACTQQNGLGAGALGAWILVGATIPVWPTQGNGSLHVTFFSVGHGLCVLCQLPRGQTLLFDAGTLGSPEYAGETISRALWAKGVRHLDGVVISHADADHFNALPGLLQRMGATDVFISPQFAASKSASVLHLTNILQKAGSRLRSVHELPEAQHNGGVNLSVIHPPPNARFDKDNAASVVIEMEFHGRRVLLTGDLEGRGMEMVVAKPPTGPVDLLQAPHHGASTGMENEDFLAWARPRITVISDGAGHNPTAQIRKFEAGGGEAWHTAVHGAVSILLTPESLVVLPFARPDRGSGHQQDRGDREGER